MREFNDIEKNILRKLVKTRKQYDIRETCLASILDEHLNTIAIEWNLSDKQEIILHCHKENNQQEQLMILLDFLCLFKYLEEQGLILVHRLGDICPDKALYNRKMYKKTSLGYAQKYGDEVVLHGRSYMLCEFENSKTFQIKSSIAELLDYYACALIHPTAKLEEFVSNNFMTKQDKQFRRNMWATRISIAVALIIGLKDELVDLLTSIIN